MPVWMFLLPLALTILIGSTVKFGSSEKLSGFGGSAVAAAAVPSVLLPFLAFGAFGAAAATPSADFAAASTGFGEDSAVASLPVAALGVVFDPVESV